MDEICTIPPVFVQKQVKTEKKYQLQLKDTGVLITLDKADWDKAKHSEWFCVNGHPTNGLGFTIEQYCGIVGKRKEQAEKFNYMRKYYEY